MISIIIPSFNRREMLKSCISRCFAAAERGKTAIEVVIADDFSTEDLRSLVENEFRSEHESGRISFVRTERNLGSAGARNLGATVARGDLLFFLDSDNEVRDGIFDEIAAAFASDERIGFVGCLSIHRRAGRDGVIWTLGSGYNHWTSRPVELYFKYPEKEVSAIIEQNHSPYFPTRYAPNAFAVRKELFEKSGGFYERFFMMYEEADFGYRIGKLGCRQIINANAVTDHLGYLEEGCVSELRALGIEKPLRTFCFARNRLWFARRHFNKLQYLGVMLLFAPLSALFYFYIALKNRRLDIATAYLKGTLVGMFTR